MRLRSYFYHMLLRNLKRLCGMSVKKSPPRLNLDSLLYRLLWNAKRVCGVSNTGPYPVIWSESRRTYVPPMEWKQLLDESQRYRLEIVLRELEILSRIYSYIPEQITKGEWQELIEMVSVKERFQYITFLRQREHRRKKAVNEKMKKKASDYEKEAVDFKTTHISSSAKISAYQCQQQQNEENNKDVEEEPEVSSLYKMFLMRSRIHKQMQDGNRYLTALRLDDTPKVAIDCSKLNILDAKMSLKADLTGQSYLELFPDKLQQNKIVYLSPHAEQELEQVELDVCYVIGGIVDRVAEPNIENQASRVVAEKEGLQCRKLPLDQHLKWQSGSKMLTLTAVLSILQDVYDSDGDWKYALIKNIPVRNIRKPDEINLKIRIHRQDIAEHQKEVFRVLIENLK